MGNYSKKSLPFIASWLALSALITSPVFSAEEIQAKPPLLTFRQFYTKVLGHYPELKKQNARVEVAIAEKMKAESKFWPRFYGVFSMTESDDPVMVFGNLLNQGRFSSENFSIPALNNPRQYQNFHYGVGGEMVLFDFFQTILAARTLDYKAKSALLGAEYARMETLLLATETYLGAIYLRRDLNELERAVNDSELDLRRAKDLSRKGMVLGADYYAAKVMLGNLIQNRNQAAQEAQGLRVVMNILMGDDPLADFQIEMELAEAPAKKKELKNAFFEAFESRPDFMALDLLLKAQKSDLLREKMSVFPKFKLFAEAEKDDRNFRDFGKSQGNNFTMGVVGSMDLFEPSYAARIKASDALSKEIEAGKDSLKDSIMQAVTREQGRYEVLCQNAPISRQIREDAKKALELMRPLYEEGRKSIVDLMQIRRGSVEASRNYYEQLFKSDSSWIRLTYMVGKLSEKDVIAIVERFKGKKQ